MKLSATSLNEANPSIERTPKSRETRERPPPIRESNLSSAEFRGECVVDLLRVGAEPGDIVVRHRNDFDHSRDSYVAAGSRTLLWRMSVMSPSLSTIPSSTSFCSLEKSSRSPAW